MPHNVAHHLSHKLEFKLNKTPAKISDRVKFSILLPSFFFASLLMLIGIYELLNGFNQNISKFDKLKELTGETGYQPFINPLFFDIIFILIGVGIIIAAISSYVKYKKFYFDGKSFSSVLRPVFGKKTKWKESLSNYTGVRFRIIFFQFGIINKNKYIIELYHKDKNKIVPLYISTSDKNIRKTWEGYAKRLNLPCIMDTNGGMITREVKNLNLSVKEMVDKGYIIDEYNESMPQPKAIALVKRNDKSVLKIRKFVLDAYNLIALIFLAMIGLVATIASISSPPETSSLLSTISISANLIIVLIFFLSFRKDKIVFKKDKIVNTHKYMLFSRKKDELPKSNIEAIDITQDPSTGRSYISIISDDRTIVFGKKLPIEDLYWIKKFLIHEVIK